MTARPPRVGLLLTRTALVAAALLCLPLDAPAAEAPNLRLLTPPDPAAPTRVSIDLYDIQVLSISEQDEVFRVSGRMQLRWIDPRQAYDPQVVGTDRLEYQGQSALDHLDEEVWWPDLEFADAVGPRDRLSVNLTLDADGEVWYRERFDVHIKQDFYLESFPYDGHAISFTLEPFTYGGRAIELVPAEDAQLPTSWEPSEWVVGDPELDVASGIVHACVDPSGEASEVREGACPGDEACPGGSRCVTDYGIPRVTVSMEISRVSSHYTGNIILPLVLILLICGSVFFMDLEATHLGDRLGLAFTGLLTVVAFDFVASGSLPKLWYSTTLDRVITASYVFTAVSIAVLLLADRWQLADGAGPRRAAALTRAFRWLFPIAYLVTVALLIVSAA